MAGPRDGDTHQVSQPTTPRCAWLDGLGCVRRKDSERRGLGASVLHPPITKGVTGRGSSLCSRMFGGHQGAAPERVCTECARLTDAALMVCVGRDADLENGEYPEDPERQADMAADSAAQLATGPTTRNTSDTTQRVERQEHGTSLQTVAKARSRRMPAAERIARFQLGWCSRRSSLPWVILADVGRSRALSVGDTIAFPWKRTDLNSLTTTTPPPAVRTSSPYGVLLDNLLHTKRVATPSPGTSTQGSSYPSHSANIPHQRRSLYGNSNGAN